MFGWFAEWLQAWKQPAVEGDLVLLQTINQAKTCRKHLVQLMEETRLARQMLEVTIDELQEHQRRVERPSVPSEPVILTPVRRQP